MSLKSLVKVSHLSNLSDARYCSGMGVDMLGFRVIPETTHYMAPGVFQEIRGWISGPKIIAEVYGVSSSHQIREAIQTYAPDYLEMTWDEYHTFRDEFTLPAIVYCSNVAVIHTLTKRENLAYLCVDEDISCDQIVSAVCPVLINVRSLEKLQTKMDGGCFAGYVLEGPEEIRPGITNYDELGTILEALEDE